MFAVRITPGAIKGNFFCDKSVLKKGGLSAQGTRTCLNGPYIRKQCGPKVPGLKFLPLSYERHLLGRD
jgi:hypothetical protein